MTQGLLPAPAWRRAGDFVYVSSIHPVDDDGALVRSSSATPYAGPSEVATQTRAILATLEHTLRDAGTTLERVLKVEVLLTDAADFPEFKHAYAQVFRDDLPAATSIVVGDEHLVEGVRVTLHAVALAADSTYERTVIRTDDVPDPTDAEHASLAVAAGPFVFCSGFPATDFTTGIPVGTTPGTPFHGNNAQMQARYVIENLQKVLAAAGTSIDQAVKVQFYEDDLYNFAFVDQEWGKVIGVPPSRSSMATRGFLVPGAVWIVNLLGLVPGHGLEKEETRAGIPWHPVDAGKANFSPGIRAGDWLFTAGQVPVPDISNPDWVGVPPGLPHYWDRMELETDFTMKLLVTQLESNGFALEDVVDARIYLVDPRRDFRGFARSWERTFAGIEARPAMSLIPSTQRDGSSGVLIEGPGIEIDLTCKKGG
ncbi:Putative aminoacrylate peracid reductase RutC [Baekduia alba]|uniref:RidA family protein n=1 Tax=Baekduia alba TaxID=2997333 RepID=UPI00233FF999|nr:RidA family protein [Baekduia alba]WCB91730.1 Putative aminoacrylate peracid reductase RutC [Baekduia alba]